MNDIKDSIATARRIVEHKQWAPEDEYEMAQALLDLVGKLSDDNLVTELYSAHISTTAARIKIVEAIRAHCGLEDSQP